MSGWIVDAEFIHDINHGYLFATEPIRRFLDRDDYLWVVSSKGMGKTLLLRYKRLRLAAKYDKHVQFVPQDKLTDFVHLPASVPSERLQKMRDSRFWADLWQMSIALSMLISSPRHDLEHTEVAELSRDIDGMPLPREIRESVAIKIGNLRARGGERPKSELQPRFARYDPSQVIALLLALPSSRVEQARVRCGDFVQRLCERYIRSSVFVFIDSFDQALERHYGDDLEIWSEGQIGLIQAVHELTRQNKHIKVYTSIRQEAFARFNHPNRKAMEGSMTRIEYSEHELQHLFEDSIQHIESCRSLSTFVGLSRFENESQEPEELFRYIYRHTLGTPRELMIVGKWLSERRSTWQPHDVNSAFLSLVGGRLSSELTRGYLYGEMKKFIGGLVTDQDVDQLLSLIPGNILKLEDLKRISQEFASRQTQTAEDHASHPFCALYNVGLLGIVVPGLDVAQRIQHFRRPYEFDWNMQKILPLDTPFYFVHPVLTSTIRSRQPRYHVSRVTVGDNCAWDQDMAQIAESERIRIFISYCARDRAMVRRLWTRMHRIFDAAGILVDPWLDQLSMKAGDPFQKRILEGLMSSDLMVVVLSRHSIESRWVDFELTRMYQNEIESDRVVVVPVLWGGLGIDQVPEMLRSKVCKTVRSGSRGTEDIRSLCSDMEQLARCRPARKTAPSRRDPPQPEL
jgi:hypothetical protein